MNTGVNSAIISANVAKHITIGRTPIHISNIFLKPSTKKFFISEFFSATSKADLYEFLHKNPDNLIVFANACAGSGKTTIAVGVADMLVKYGFYKGNEFDVSNKFSYSQEHRHHLLR